MNDAVNNQLRGRSVFVGLSGGVDSAVTAALLKERGARVTGVFIQGWYPPGLPCTWAEDRRDAMRVAAHLRIPFVTLDASSEYKKGVIEYLLREYAAGRTPNPDIMCNREVKFGAFLKYAEKQGADFIATGHYAQVPHAGGEPRLFRGRDESKDQSYFLWAISKNALSKTLFPLGGFTKARVRELARKFKLPVQNKPDSQGICFLGSVSVDDFLRSEFGVRSGAVISEQGETIGAHDGAALYTLGQRISLRAEAPPGPWYVIRKDMASNTLTVAHAQEMKQTGNIRLTDANWFRPISPNSEVEAQYRYHGPRVRGTFDVKAAVFTPAGSLPETPASGQSLVLYQSGSNGEEDECLGGGIIS